MWPIEVISDESFLFVRVHKDFSSSQDGFPKKTAFRNTPETGPNLSSDWNKYSTALETRLSISKQQNPRTGFFKNPSDFYIWQFRVEALRKLEIRQVVEHDPIYNNPEIIGSPNNRAHSIITGDKPINQAKFSTEIQRAGSWVVHPSLQNDI